MKLTVTERSGDQIEAVYQTEDKYEWKIAGTSRGGVLAWRFLALIKGTPPDDLVEHGELTDRVKDDEMLLQFHDTHDNSRADIRLRRLAP